MTNKQGLVLQVTGISHLEGLEARLGQVDGFNVLGPPAPRFRRQKHQSLHTLCREPALSLSRVVPGTQHDLL